MINALKCRFRMVWTDWRIVWQWFGRGASTPEWWRQVQRRCCKGETLEQWTKNDVIVTIMLQRGLCRSPQAPLQGSSTSGLRSEPFAKENLFNNWIVYKTWKSLLSGNKPFEQFSYSSERIDSSWIWRRHCSVEPKQDQVLRLKLLLLKLQLFV